VIDARIDVWRIRLARPAAEVAALESMLDPTERHRASRFRFQRDRRRFVVAHAALRSLLGEYTGVEPRRVNLTVRSGGKPVMSCGGVRDTPHFNLAHSGDLALCAISNAEVGVDCERLGHHDDIERVSRQFFSVEEAGVLRAHPAADQMRFFLRTWVRKEAYLKATGEGLARDTTTFTVLGSAGGVTLHGVNGGNTDHSYRVYDLPEIDDHFAAVAVAGAAPSPVFEYRDWET
jgi:4'-phosphopantetheinyl transferase